jgi:hypothetical protein
MKLPRLFHRIYAKINNKFWLPCTVCGECFGAHEDWGYNKHQRPSADDRELSLSGKGFNIICPSCQEEQERLPIDELPRRHFRGPHSHRGNHK